MKKVLRKRILATISASLLFSACATTSAAVLNTSPETQEIEATLKKDSDYTVESKKKNKSNKQEKVAEQKKIEKKNENLEKVDDEDLNPKDFELDKKPEIAKSTENKEIEKVEETDFDEKQNVEVAKNDSENLDEKEEEESVEIENKEIVQVENEDLLEDEQFDYENKITPSRTVSLKTNQYLEVTYPGKGWEFIGEYKDSDEIASIQHLSFFGKKLGKGDTSFTLRSKLPGDAILHFYKNDALTGEYIDDYLQVTVESVAAKGNEKNEKIVAPLYADLVPAQPDKSRLSMEIVANSENLSPLKENPSANKPIYEDKKVGKVEKSENVSSNHTDKTKTNIQKTEKTTSKVNNEKPTEIATSEEQKGNFTNIKKVEPEITFGSEELLEKARNAFDSQNYSEALSFAQKYLDSTTDNADEALYLLGAIRESDSEQRDIKSAIDSYNTIVKEYPTSKLWKRANQRVIYLKRFYIDIR